MTMSTRTRTLPLVTLPLLLVVTGATAQQLDLQSPVPNTSRDRSRLPHEESRTRALMPQTELYPYRPALPYQPGFIDPFTKETATGRMGVAGWTSPNTSAGSRGAADPDNPGWPGLGIAVEWGGSPKKTMTP
jgi:hypothetical protein